MKTYNILACFLLAISSIISCNNDSENSYVTNFLSDYLKLTKFENKVTSIKNGNSMEAGLFFTPSADGKITKLKVKIPDVNNALKITLWKGPTILKTETVNVTKADTEQVFDISDVMLTKGTEYAIPMNYNDWYKRTITDGSNATYPVSYTHLFFPNASLQYNFEKQVYFAMNYNRKIQLPNISWLNPCLLYTSRCV